jgi:myo-inositol 2-dehydrogenase / D-chiro-inositol 1-dehydrogenase
VSADVDQLAAPMRRKTDAEPRETFPDAPPLTVAVIGAGDMGSRHAKHWHSLGARVVAVVDPDLPRAEAAAAAVGARADRGADAVLADPEIEVISVCTPTHLHAPFTVAALEAGKHVLCEKPAALTLRDAQAMEGAAQRSGKELRIGFMRRFDPAFRQLMDYAQRAGQPLLAQATITAGVRPKRLMHDALVNGGPIIDMCCHVFNLWDRILGGEPVAVSARGYTFSLDKPEVAHIATRALDSALITLEYADGSVGQLQVSWGLPAGIEPVERHTYVGPAGLVTVDWNQHLTLRDASGVTRWRSRGVDPWRAQIEQFRREIQVGAAREVAGIAAGIAALRVSLAVLEAIRTQRFVAPADVADLEAHEA